MKNIFEEIEKQIKEKKENIFIIEEEREISYEQFYNDLLKVKKWFKELGIIKRDKVCTILPSIYEHMLIYTASLFSGITICPLNIFDKSQILKHKIREVDSSALIFWNNFDVKIEKTIQEIEKEIKLISVGKSTIQNSQEFSQFLNSEQDESLFDDLEKEDLAIILFTSGISGKLKACSFTYQNLIYAVEIFTKSLLIRKSETFLGTIPLFHPAAQSMSILPAIFNTSRLVLQTKFDVTDIINEIYKQGVSIFPGTYTMFETLAESLESLESRKNNLRIAISTGGKIDKNHKDKFEKFFDCEILEGYGTTETLFLITCKRPNDLSEESSLGIPYEGIEIKIVNRKKEELKPQEEGEIAVKGEHVFKEYFNDFELTEDAKIDGWFYTGDIGKLNEQNFLYFLEKKYDVIHKGGFLIYPTEIEEILLKNPKIKEVAVIGVNDIELGEEIKAFITLNDNIRVEPEEIYSYCREHLPLYKCPKYLKFTPVLPKSHTGKVLKRYLKGKKYQ